MSDTRIDTKTMRLIVKSMTLRPEERDYLRRVAHDIDKIMLERDALQVKLNELSRADLHEGRGWDRFIA